MEGEISIENQGGVGIAKLTNSEENKKKESPLVIAVEKIINTPIPLITDKEIIPPSGDKRDFVSLSPYWYRNENGELEVRDGEVNPEVKKYHDSDHLSQVEGNIYLTSLAVKDTENQSSKERFSRYAVANIRTWFVDEGTRMTPSFEFAQMKQGETEGNFYGIIEGAGLVRVIEGVNALREEELIDDETHEGVKQWFKDYLKWLRTSSKAIGNVNATNEKARKGEKGMSNNHGTFYDVQVAYIADFLGDRDLVLETLNSAKERIKDQILPDGEMPEESKRLGGSAESYEIFNLQAFSELALLGQKYDVDLWNWKTEDGRGMRKAFEYFSNKLKAVGEMPFKFDRKGAMYEAFRAASVAYGNQEYWDLPTKYYLDPMVDGISTKLFRTDELKV